ncbi:hypothetical protein SAMN02745165_03095 [Malonomonas rubra DSM 5091]|uniref:Uncharacterized protein n=1 Tax=Malonomonas rubra DSM 5091 TaxID=1122189 RepID=A0A1M6LXM2_MALRU|nr:hypothetical protein [Malonomonas rubra]SHJ75870.1 hypothetical protein SAMN02745165_03095 [Malonomonas rubra DSM 5091]
MNTFKLVINLAGHILTNRSLSALADLMTKIQAFDQSLLENGTIDLGVEHILYPELTGNKCEFTVQVNLKTDESKLEFVEIKKIKDIYDYLENSRKIILEKLLSATSESDFDFAHNQLDETAKKLKEKINHTFIPNESRIVRNAMDLVSLNKIFNNFILCMET